MTNIIPATLEHVPHMVKLWNEQLGSGDSIEEVRHCVENYPSYVSVEKSSKINGLSYTFAIGKDTLLLHGLLVAARQRNNRVGGNLLASTEARAKSLGYMTVLLTNSMQYQGTDKQSAIPFYSKHGYKVIHTSPNDPPTYVMVKDL